MTTPKLTSRVLSNTLYLPSLADEIANLARRKNIKKARAELESVIQTAVDSKSLWPEEPAARAALLLWLLGKRRLPALDFRHRRDLTRRELRRSVLIDRNYRR